MNMQALVLNRYNGPLELTEIPRPGVQPGQVLVRIKASGLNPLDTKIRAGSAAHAQHPLPLVLGIDMAGVVEAVWHFCVTRGPNTRNVSTLAA